MADDDETSRIEHRNDPELAPPPFPGAHLHRVASPVRRLQGRDYTARPSIIGDRTVFS